VASSLVPLSSGNSMINNRFGRFAPVVLLLAAVSPAFAGEVGVTNSWSHGTRTGTGTSQLDVNSRTDKFDNSTSTATKIETGSAFNVYTGSNSSAENTLKANISTLIPGNASADFTAKSTSEFGSKTDSANYSFNASASTKSESRTATSSNTLFKENSTFRFADDNGSHSVSAFSN